MLRLGLKKKRSSFGLKYLFHYMKVRSGSVTDWYDSTEKDFSGPIPILAIEETRNQYLGRIFIYCS